MRRRASAGLLLLALAAIVAGCGGSSADDGSVQRPPLTSGRSLPATTATTTTAAPATTTATTPAGVPTTTPSTVPTTTNAGGAPPSAPPSSGGAPASCPSSVGGFVHDVHVSGADCSRARAVGEAWFAAVHGGASPASQLAADGYDCSGTLDGERADVTCTSSGGGTVSFTASP
jgi:hypothetical protein